MTAKWMRIGDLPIYLAQGKGKKQAAQRPMAEVGLFEWLGGTALRTARRGNGRYWRATALYSEITAERYERFPAIEIRDHDVRVVYGVTNFRSDTDEAGNRVAHACVDTEVVILAVPHKKGRRTIVPTPLVQERTKRPGAAGQGIFTAETRTDQVSTDP